MIIPAYETLSDCGSYWLSKLPSHWQLKSLKHIAGVFGRIGFRGYTTADIVDQGEGAISLSPSNIVDNKLNLDKCTYVSWEKYNESPEIMVFAGDVIYVKTSSIGKVAYVEDATTLMTINPQLVVFKDCKIDSKFLALSLGCGYLQAQAQVNASGGVTPTMTQESIGSFKIAIPPENEQQKIIAFLDHETAKIDRLIANQEQLIQLLKEKRQAVIAHAVTKGLDPGAPMKDSGVEWLGEVPAHWGVSRVARLFGERVEYGRTDLPVLSVSIHYGVTDKELTQEESDRKLQRIENKESYKIVEAGDLVYNMMRAWQGAFGATKVDGLVSPAYVIAKPLIELETDYFEAVLRTSAGIEEMRRYSKGITDFRLRLYWDEFRTIQLPVPPLPEQKAIVNKLNEITLTTERIISKAEESVALMKEHRTALISAAVTGKIDVRGWQKPDTEPEVKKLPQRSAPRERVWTRPRNSSFSRP